MNELWGSSRGMPKGVLNRAETMDNKERESEQIQADERSAPSGAIVYKAILKEGTDELRRPSSALFWSGLAAGLSMGFSLIAEGLLRTYLPEAGWHRCWPKWVTAWDF